MSFPLVSLSSAYITVRFTRAWPKYGLDGTSLAQLVRAWLMYCWQLCALFQGPGFESHWGVLFISHSNSLASDSTECISPNILTEGRTSHILVKDWIKMGLGWTTGRVVHEWYLYFFRVDNVAQNVRVLLMYCWVLGSHSTEVCCSLATQTV